MTLDAPTGMISVPFGLAAIAVLGIAVVAVFRSRKQDTSAPELRHVLPVGAGCLSAFAGFVLCAVGQLTVGASTGVPAIRVEANRFNPESSLLLKAHGVPQMMTVNTAVRPWAF